jgi:arabinofuranosyltransferase
MARARLWVGYRAAVVAAIVAAGCTELIRTAWISDDAAITLRSVLNLLHGYGPTFNVDERVQAFTHPLWFLLISAASVLIGNVFAATFVLSIGLSLLVLYIVLARLRATFWTGVLAAAVLLCSKAYVDFSTSGLENPLAHVLVLIAALSAAAAERGTASSPLPFFVTCSLLYLTRPDLLVLASPLAVFVCVRYRHQPAVLIRSIAIGSLPALAWTLWATYYYGFPFPNTAYAKLGAGVPLTERIQQGVVYLADSLKRDPLTLVFMTVSACICLTSSTLSRVLALASIAYVVFVVTIGGDFMSGRFLTAPLVATVVAFSAANPSGRQLALVAAGMFGLATLTLDATLLSGSTYSQQRIDDNGIADERGFYFQLYGLVPAADPDRRFQEPVWTVNGKSVSVICGGLGFTGIALGAGAHLIDECALADPLLARLPAERSSHWRIGHFTRQLPTDYQESIVRGANLLPDAATHAYYESIRMITRGPLNRWARLRAVVRVNLGWIETPNRRMYYETKIPRSSHRVNRVLKTVQLGTDRPVEYSYAIYADVAGRRLYISQNPSGGPSEQPPAGGPRMTILDLDTLELVAKIDGIAGARMAVDPRSRHGFVITGNRMSAFDAATMKPLPVDPLPGAHSRDLAFDALSGMIYVLRGDTQDIVAIDPARGTQAGTIHLPGIPLRAVSDRRGTLYALVDTAPRLIARVSLTDMIVTKQYVLSSRGTCDRLALDGGHQLLFVACVGPGTEPPLMLILDAADGTLVSRAPLAGAPDGLEFNPATMEAFSSHDNGTMTVVTVQSDRIFDVSVVDIANGAVGVAVDSKMNHTFVLSDEPGAGAFTLVLVGT